MKEKKTAPSPVTTTPVKPKRRKKAPLLNLPKKGSKKTPAFDAFEVKRDDKIEVVAPETGIHSQEWALKIIPQAMPLLRIPLEVRTRIFEILFRSYYSVLSPMKHGKGFYSSNIGFAELRGRRHSPPAEYPTKTYIDVSLVCRQIYVEVVGGAMLYRMGEFYFGSGLLMNNYLTKINPFHVSSITSIHLSIRLHPNSLTIPKRLTQLLAKVHSLKYLTINLYIDEAICDNRFLPLPNGTQFVLSEKICAKIESSKNWEFLKGLKSFRMEFRTDGTFTRQQTMSIQIVLDPWL
ncbi:hypothetical protein DL98DRAFT_651014 [Cadophora sp. DSE1049]|nr:hypothetical protein DL98DRAFT_651014 [Cadophora sp. DSE1049]